MTELFLKSTITKTHTAAVVVYNAARHQQDLSSWSGPAETVKLQVLQSKSENNEGSYHCSSAPYHACKSELCTLGAGETAGFVVMCFNKLWWSSVLTTVCVCVLYHVFACCVSAYMCCGMATVQYPRHLSWVSQLTASLHILLHCLLTSRVPQSPTCRRFRSSWRRRDRSLRWTNTTERPGVPLTTQVRFVSVSDAVIQAQCCSVAN